MAKQSDARDGKRVNQDQAPRKKTYRAPKLTEYGDLRKITMGKGSNRGDGGGNPATKR